MAHDFQKNIPLKQFTTYQIGGPADLFIEVKTPDELIEAITQARKMRIHYKIIGGGSNILIDDNGFRGLIIKNSITGIKAISNDTYEFMSGEVLDSVVKFTCDQNLFGMECLSGIPGSIGGAIVQNAGAYGQEICETTLLVKALRLSDLQIIELTYKECKFEYRKSLFKNSDEFIVLSSQHTLSKTKLPNKFAGMEIFNQKDTVFANEIRELVISQRKTKSTFWDPSDKNSMTCGSFFTNPIIDRELFLEIQSKGFEPVYWDTNDNKVKISGGWIIENAGFSKGYHYKTIRISEKSALSIANWGNGLSKDIKELAAKIEKAVYEKFGVQLIREVIYL